ncbi:MAG: hypothetical protein IKP63_04935, partial [Paludibacteraceae bacterium]|nr:hypothetical protein [Paludibacteraceae bacterium]
MKNVFLEVIGRVNLAINKTNDNMKSFFSKYIKVLAILLLSVVGVGQAWGASVTVGYTSTTTTTSGGATTETFSGVTGLTVTKNTNATSSTTVVQTYTKGDKEMYFESTTKLYSKNALVIKTSSKYGEYYGYSVTVAAGKKISLTQLAAKLCGSYNFTWKVVINNGSSDIYTSEQTITNYNKATSTNATMSKDISSETSLDDLTGTFYVRLYAKAGSTGKYFCIPQLEITGDLEDVGGGCSAPTSPSISGTTAYTAGDDISLTASATGTSGTTTYTWYKGADWATASASSPVQAASTSGATFSKASCVVGDAGTYWCNISNGTGCDVQVSKVITVSAGGCTPISPSLS